MHHDHDEELGMYWYDAVTGRALTDRSSPRKAVTRKTARPRRDNAYWDETVRLVLDYLRLKAGSNASAGVVDGFVLWIALSPANLTAFGEGDDMCRAEIVDRYLASSP
jgi:hypothetical protein